MSPTLLHFLLGTHILVILTTFSAPSTGMMATFLGYSVPWMALLTCVCFFLFFYVWLFALIRSAVESKKTRLKFRQRFSTFHGTWLMLKTIFDSGFIKVSIRRCYRFHAIRWPFSSSSLPACAEVGKMAPDVSIYNIHGHPQRLHEYIQTLPADCPLVLNFGSYT